MIHFSHSIWRNSFKSNYYRISHRLPLKAYSFFEIEMSNNRRKKKQKIEMFPPTLGNDLVGCHANDVIDGIDYRDKAFIFVRLYWIGCTRLHVYKCDIWIILSILPYLVSFASGFTHMRRHKNCICVCSVLALLATIHFHKSRNRADFKLTYFASLRTIFMFMYCKSKRACIHDR